MNNTFIYTKIKKKKRLFVACYLWNYKTTLKNNAGKLVVTISDPRQATFYVDTPAPKGVSEQKSPKIMMSEIVRAKYLKIDIEVSFMRKGSLYMFVCFFIEI